MCLKMQILSSFGHLEFVLSNSTNPMLLDNIGGFSAIQAVPSRTLINYWSAPDYILNFLQPVTGLSSCRTVPPSASNEQQYCPCHAQDWSVVSVRSVYQLHECRTVFLSTSTLPNNTTTVKKKLKTFLFRSTLQNRPNNRYLQGAAKKNVPR